MKREELRLGMKVVIKSKSVSFYGEPFANYLKYRSLGRYFTENGFLVFRGFEVAYPNQDEVCVCGATYDVSGDFFAIEDLEPYNKVEEKQYALEF